MGTVLKELQLQLAHCIVANPFRYFFIIEFVAHIESCFHITKTSQLIQFTKKVLIMFCEESVRGF